ncbi:MAG: helix-turn-helix transcriptional regulator [Gammaproteobacteria bacterium]|nr:helix-turn-helix transcriptional regulator [Gammaproteobacteria bacterium]
MLRKTLAGNIVKLRTASQLSQKELANKAGLSKSFISGVERTAVNISLGNVEAIAEVLGVEAYVLLIPVESPNPPH